MEYQNIINLLEDTTNHPAKFRTKNWVETNDDPCETYNTNNQIEFKTLMLMPILCDYNDGYLLVSGTITITRVGADDVTKRLDEIKKYY